MAKNSEPPALSPNLPGRDCCALTPATLPPGTLTSGRSSQTILIVEDDPVVNEFLQEVLSSFGFQVLIAMDGEQGLSLFEAEKDEISCVILDFGLPGMHASRVLSRMREIKTQVKILLSSGYASSDISADISFDTVDGFIPKPYNSSFLLQELERVCQVRK